MVAKIGMNLAQKFTRPTKLRTSAADCGCLASVIASTFAFVGPIPHADNKCPINSSSDTWNFHFSCLGTNPFPGSSPRTFHVACHGHQHYDVDMNVLHPFAALYNLLYHSLVHLRSTADPKHQSLIPKRPFCVTNVVIGLESLLNSTW